MRINLHYHYFINCHHRHQHSCPELHTRNREEPSAPVSRPRPARRLPGMQVKELSLRLPKLDQERRGSWVLT